jgi:hypothetical protein
MFGGNGPNGGSLAKRLCRVAAPCAFLALTLGVSIAGTTAGAATLARANLAKPSLTSNPTCQSAGGLRGCVQAWSTGLTVSYAAASDVSDGSQAVYYGNLKDGGQMIELIGCVGPDFSVFIPLSPGEWAGYATLITGAAVGLPTLSFDLHVGAPGSKAPPETSCIALPPFSGFVDSPVVGMAPSPDGKGYWLVGSDGSVEGFGSAGWYGDMSGQQLNAPIVGMAPTADGRGYWLVGQDGGVFSFGDAQFYGSTGNIQLNQPVVGMTATPDGKGYWFVAADGGVFSYGDAHFYGSTGSDHLNKPVVGMTATPSGHGYYLDASDGGVFAFGDAHFQGSMGATALNQPVVGMSIDPATGGYWEVAADGGIFSFDAPFFGSAGNTHLNQPITGMTNTPTGRGYRFVASDGGVFDYGDAQFFGSGTQSPDTFATPSTAVLSLARQGRPSVVANR